jgi:hypothetical protein
MAGITSTKKIKGQPHLLAYITPNEVEKLKALGGQETMTKEGIPAYPESDYYGVSQSDFNKGDFSRSRDENVRNLATGKTGVTQQQLAAINAKERQDAIKKDIEKRALEKSNYVKPNPFKSAFDYGKNYLRNRQKGIYNIVPNNPKRELEFLSSLRITNPAKYNTLPQNLKDVLEATDQDFAPSYKDSAKFSFEDFDSLTKFDDGAFATYAKDRGSPGLSVSGDMSKVGIKSVRRDPITGEPIKDMFGNTLFDYGPPRDGGSGGEGQNLLPLNYGVGVGTANTEDAVDDNEFTYRFGNDQKVGRDVTLGYAANGGRITRAGGGIMNAVPRQGFFLGKIAKGIGKAIGSVADAAGKVLKSDVGKMAALGLGAYYMPGFGIKATGGFGNMFAADGFLKTAGKKLLLKDGMNFGDKGALSLGKILGLSAALPFIPGINKVPENEDIGMTERGGRLKDSQGNEVLPAGIRKEIDEAYASGDAGRIEAIENYYAFLPPRNQYLPYPNYAVGGRVAAQEGGLMNLGGMEKDYRNEGGFVPIGKQEKADDVPARLSVNEFVFTADAVRNAGGGDIDKGAEVMENMMKNLENGGTVSEESQGNTGAQEMFSVSERIGEVI